MNAAHAAEPARRGIAPRQFSTESVPADRRFDSWRRHGWPSVASIFDVRATEPFTTTADQYVLEDIILQFAEGTARHFERSRARLRGDRVNVLGINVMLTDGMTFTAQGKTTPVPANAMLLVDAGQPIKIYMPSGDSVQVVLPRDVAEAQLGRVADLHGTVVPAGKSAIVLSHLAQLRGSLADFSPDQGGRLARTILDTLAIATTSTSPTPVAIGNRSVADAARAAIEANLSRPSLNATWLAQHLGISRSTLYRSFDEQGVEAFVRAARLERVRRALVDPSNRDPIGDLAYRWGFSDASHLARLFRAAFGTTPSAFRRQSRTHAED